MTLGVICALGFVFAWAMGADLRRLAELHLRASWLVFIALAFQLVAFVRISGIGVRGSLEVPFHLASYAILILFAAANARVRGFGLATLGLLSNAIVIVANGGRMPVPLRAWESTGGRAGEILGAGHYNNNVVATGTTHLRFLADVFPLPHGLPLANTFSIGDLLLLAGATLFVYCTCTDGRERNLRAALRPLAVPGFRRLLFGRAVSKCGDWLDAGGHDHVDLRAHALDGLRQPPPARPDRRCDRRRVRERPDARPVPADARPGGGRARPGGMRRGDDRRRGGRPRDAAPPARLRLLVRRRGDRPDSIEPRPRPASPEPRPSPMRSTRSPEASSCASARSSAGLRPPGSASGRRSGSTSRRLRRSRRLRAPAGTTGGGAPSIATAEPRLLGRRDVARAILRSRLLVCLVGSFVLATLAMGVLNASLAEFLASVPGSGGYGVGIAAIAGGLVCGEFLTGFLREASVVRRAPAIAFGLSAVFLALASRTTAPTTVLLLLFLLGASDGVTETAYDTLVQGEVALDVRAGVFALAGEVQQGGMVVGLALAPVLAGSSSSAPLRLAAVATACGAFMAVGMTVHGPRLSALPTAAHRHVADTPGGRGTVLRLRVQRDGRLSPKEPR